MRLILITLLMIPCLVFSQERPLSVAAGVNFSAKQIVTETNVKSDTSQTDRIITCLDNYRTERRTAFGIGIGGAALAGVASISGSAPEDESLKRVLYIGAGAAALTSIVMYFNAERWLSRKKLTFNGSSVSLRF